MREKISYMCTYDYSRHNYTYYNFKKGHAAENDRELINIIKQNKYFFYVNLW